MITNNHYRQILVLCFAVLCFVNTSLSSQVRSTPKLRDSILRQYEGYGIDSVILHYLELEGIAKHDNNKITLLRSGTEKFADLQEYIRQAKHHIHLEYFNFRNDSISRQIFELLKKKRKEGIEVRVMFDAFGNMSNNQPLKRKYLDSLRKDGIQIVKVDPIRFPWVNHVSTRDHRKLVIIDGKIGYLGGMNIADYYINGLDNIGQWRDLHCRIEGSAVLDMQKIFLSMWQKETEEALLGTAYYPTPIDSIGTHSLSVVDRSPKEQPDAIKDAYALAIAGADSVINIVNPYFVPTKAISSAIKKAIKKGIDVNIMVSAKSDIPFTPEAMKHKLRKLSKLGANVHLYTEGFHHSKVMTVDGKLSTVGSANLNSRSLRYDYETNVFIYDKEVTQQLDSIYHSDLKHSIPLDDKYWKKRSLWKKFVGWFANIFTPFL